MRKLAIAVMLLLSAITLAAQETKTGNAATNPQFSWAKAPYRLDFVIKEVDDGKVINSRSYSMIVEASDRLGWGKGVVKSGNRVPVATGSKDGNTQIQYIDLGANIDATLSALENGGLILNSSIEISAVAANEPQSAQSLPDPVIRQMRAEVSSEVFPGKANQIAALDDVASKHRFIIEVTPTKLK
jgi:hypothetical protein